MNETLIIFCIICIIFLVISELFGRAKHIGRWWTFFLLVGGFLPGLLALIFSPSAKKEPTKGGKSYKIWGIISLIFGFLNIIPFVATSGKQGYTFIALIILGLYLIQLSNGKVINLNPKFYFQNLESKPKTTFKNYSPSIKNQFLYFIIENGKQSETPLSFEELKNKKISENTFVWRNGLEAWLPAKELSELCSIIVFSPPPFRNEENKNQNTPTPPPFNF